MLTLWGTLNQVHRDDASVDWVQVKTVLPDRTTIRIRAMIGYQTTVVRGIQRVDPTRLKVGDVVEVSYCHGHNGGIEAKTVYVFPDEATMS